MRKYNFTINNKNISVAIKSIGADTATVIVNREEISVKINEVINCSATGESSDLPYLKQQYKQAPARPVNNPIVGNPRPIGKDTGVHAPIPGLVKKILVSEGQKVSIGQKVLIMEAMKMENEITSDIEGTVKKVIVKEGDNVAQDEQMILIE